MIKMSQEGEWKTKGEWMAPTSHDQCHREAV